MQKEKIIYNIDFFGGVIGFLLFGNYLGGVLFALIGIPVGVFVAHAFAQVLTGLYEKEGLIASKPSQKPQERTQPQEQAQSTKPQEKDPQNANKAEEKITPEPPPKPEGVIVGIAVDGEKPGAELILEPSLRIRHLYLIGKTRTGKTTLIKNLALQDMDAGHGLCFVDPHGDAADDLIGSIPQHRLQDVIYFDPASENCPAFNILRTSFAPQKLTEDIVNVLKMFFGSSWGFRMEHILRYAILTLLHDREPRTLKDLRTLLLSETYRAEIIANIEDETIREFWELEFAEYPRSAVDPIINKLSSFLVPGSPLLKLFSQKENALDFTCIMNEQKILIVNLSKGLLSEDPSRLLGGLIVTGIQQAALGRASMPPEQRKDFHLYLDEFQNFVVESFESILSEAAKYKLFLTLAHQTLGQVPGYLKHGIFGNVATLIAFQISAEDAATMGREMHRTRYMYRRPGSTQHEELTGLLNETRRYLEENPPLASTWKRELEKDTARLDEYIKNKPQYLKEYYRSWGTKAEAERIYQANLESIRKTIEVDKSGYSNTLQKDREQLQRLYASDLTPAVLKEVTGMFADYEFRQLTFPDTDDFINQKPRHAFCRRERAENVTLFRTLPAPDPNPAIKAAVFQEMKARYGSRIYYKPETPPRERFTFTEKKSEEEKQQAPTAPPEMPEEQPHAKEATPTIDPVEAARQRRAQKGTPKRSTPKRTPTPQNEEDFRF